MNSGNAVERIRESLEAVVLVSPSVIGGLLETESCGNYSVMHFPKQLELSSPSSWDQFSRRVRVALAALPFESGTRPDVRAVSVLSADDAHDAYFRVARTTETDAAAYARGLLQGLSVWVTDAWDGAPIREM